MRNIEEVRSDIDALYGFLKGRTGDVTVYSRRLRELHVELLFAIAKQRSGR